MVSRRAAGFTLIELMVIVVIIAVLYRFAVPGVRAALSMRRSADASLEVVRLARMVQDLAITADGASAYTLHVDTSQGVGGLIRVLRGTTGRCWRQNWQAINAQCPPRARPNGQVEPCPVEVDIGASATNDAAFETRLRIVPPGQENNLNALLTGAGTGIFSMCAESTGALYYSQAPLAATMPLDLITNVNGAYMFTTGTVDISGPRVVDVPRVALLPFGGMARRLR